MPLEYIEVKYSVNIPCSAVSEPLCLFPSPPAPLKKYQPDFCSTLLDLGGGGTQYVPLILYSVAAFFLLSHETERRSKETTFILSYIFFE